MNNLEKKNLEAEQALQDEKLRDVLAASMITMHHCAKVRNEQGSTHAYMQAIVIIEDNPGFVTRFKKRISDDVKKKKLEEVHTPPPDPIL